MGVASFKFILSRAPKADGTFGVLLRITKSRVVREVPTGIWLPAAHFNAAATTDTPRWVRTANHDGHQLNRELTNRIRAARALHLAHPALSAAQLADALRRNFTDPTADEPADFFSAAAAEIAGRRNASTANRLGSAVATFRRFVGAPVIDLAQIDRPLIRKFEYWLFQQPDIKSANSVTSVLVSVATLLRQQLRDGAPGTDPFVRYKYPSAPTAKAKLTRDEITAMEELPLPVGSPLWRARSAFLIQFYAHGARIGDVLELLTSDVYENRLSYKMGKTGKIKSVAIPDALANIIDTLKAHYPGTYLLPYVCGHYATLSELDQLTERKRKTSLINKYLKDIARAIGCPKKLTTHVARHSLANLADRATLDTRAVQRLLGHSKIATTERYLADLRDDELDAAAALTYGGPKLPTNTPPA
jgi:site-specific recombinase XerD